MNMMRKTSPPQSTREKGNAKKNLIIYLIIIGKFRERTAASQSNYQQ